jgi:uncharacterized protein YwqG
MKMNSLFLILLFLAFTVYLAVKSGVAQNKDLANKIEEHKRRFPDTTKQYVWKDYNPITKEEFKNAFDKEGLSEKWSYFENHLKPEIRLTIQNVPESEIPIGQTKIGGRPDLPKEIEWPKQNNGKHLAFLAQINLNEVDNIELTLPDQGIIYFFYSEDQEFWGYSKENANDFRVMHSINTKELERREIPTTLTTLKNGMYQPCKVEYTNSYSLPNWEHEFVSEQFKDMDNDPYIDISSSGEYITKLGGHSINVQGTMEYECEMVDRGYDWNSVPPSEKDHIKESQYRWQLLFQLDSENEAQMMWGDVGKLYFWIKEEDLKSRRFDKTWLMLQCH